MAERNLALILRSTVYR